MVGDGGTRLFMGLRVVTLELQVSESALGDQRLKRTNGELHLDRYKHPRGAKETKRKETNRDLNKMMYDSLAKKHKALGTAG